MALETPSWLNLSFVEKILRKSEDDSSIQVIDMLTKPATNKGDNYTSDMIRVIVEFSRRQNDREITQKKSIVVKLSPMDDGMRKELITKAGLFDVEICMMTDTLERMNRALPDSRHRHNARILYAQKDPTLLAIEDLAPLGFRMADRQAGLDLRHSLMAIRGLANFHATSVLVCEKDPKLKLRYTRGIFNSEFPPEMGQFFVQGVKVLAEEVAKWPELGNRYSEKLQKLSDHVYQVGIEACRRCDDEFNVINHGDFWVNNMLFKYDADGKPIDHILVDFQLCLYSTPAVDLHYFFSTSPSMDVMENHRADLLNEYHSTLLDTMKRAGCETQPFTMDELKRCMKQRASYGMIAAFTVLPLMLCNRNEAKDINEIMGMDGSYENPAYKGEIYRKIMTKKLPEYERLGFLDL